MGRTESLRRYAQRIKIFHGMMPEEVSEVLSKGRSFEFPEGKTIFHEGTHGNCLFVVLHGDINIHVKNKHIATCHVGEAFGEMAVLNEEPRSASAVAATPVKLFALNEAEVRNLLNTSLGVKFLLNVIHVLSERLALANMRKVKEAR